VDLGRLQHLEAAARRLEPGAAERQHLLGAAGTYAERFLAALPDLPGYVDDDAAAEAALPTPIVAEYPEDTARTLATLWDGVDRIGVNEMAGHFFGFIPGPTLHAGAVADYLAAVTNRYGGVAFGAPGLVRLQRRLLDWIGGHVGYPRGSGGDLTSGGSIANLTAIVTARDAAGAEPAAMPNLVVYLTRQAHHSVDKALRIAGLASATRRRIPVDARSRMDPEALRRQIDQDRADGLRPWLVVASAGTTDTGAIDPLARIGDVAAANGLWFHVDAAYGGAFALCETGRRRLDGIERSDSLVIDPHKGLFVPFGTGLVLVKDRDAMIRSHGAAASYMQDALADAVDASPADVSPELTRPNRVLRVWLPLRLHGAAAFRAALEEKLALAEYLHAGLSEIADVEVGPPPDLSVVTFRCHSRDGDMDAATRRLHEALLADGRIFLSSTTIDGAFTLRMAIVNARTHREHVDRALDAIAALAPPCS
jgi:glutamate/tyrosine decarboxylase-like PLP-dependent enzyme